MTNRKVRKQIMKLKDYTCPSCGGVLIIDKAVKVYRCQFCGVTYDYNYFMGDDVLDRAYSYLRHKEFKAAKEAFEFILKKEPFNALAYRGLLLVRAELTDISKFRAPGVFEKLPYKDMKGIVEKALQNVGDDDRDFFEKFDELLENGERYREAKRLQDKNELSASTKEDQAENLFNKATNKKENIKLRIFVETFFIFVLLGVILAIPGYFWLSPYHCRVSRGFYMAKKYVLDEDNDGSVRNEEDWNFMVEHDGMRNIGKNGEEVYGLNNGDRYISFYLRNGRTYFAILASILSVIGLIVVVIQILRIRKRVKESRISDMYEQVELIEADAKKDKSEYDAYRKDANLIARDLNRSLAELMKIDPYVQAKS